MARSLTARVAAIGFGIELIFAVAIPVAYLQLFDIDGTRNRAIVLAIIGALYVVRTAALIAYLASLLRPIEQWLSDSSSQRAPDLVRRAARAAYDAPLLFPFVWAISWLLFYLPVTASLQHWFADQIPLSDSAGAVTMLFGLSCFAAALPLSYAMVSWLLGPVAGRISLALRELELPLPGRRLSVRTRLVVLSLSLIIAPTVWMGMYAYTSQLRAGRGGELSTLLFFALVALSWAPICAAFLAGSMSRPLRRIHAVVDKIVARGDVERLGPIPVFHRDELGELAQGVNEMIDRLQASAERIRRYGAEREQALAEAASRAAELDAVIDNMVEGVFACDRNGAVTHMNAAGLRLLDLSASVGGRAFPGESGDGVALVHSDGRPFARAELPLLRALAGEVIVEEDDTLESPGSHGRVFLRSSAAPIRDATGAITGAVAVARDVTEVAEFDRLKDEFIRVAAHELKTPVAILKGYALTLLRTGETLPPRSRRMLEAIDRGAERINGIIDDLLDVSQARLDTLRLAPGPVDLDDLVRTTLAAAAVSELHRFVIRREDPAPLMVRADSARTRQALRNLLSNALKYSPTGGTIEVALGADRARAEARVSIRDYGVGIPEQRQGGIFRLFYRAHTDTPYDYGGMGVGLYMAKELIKRQGGRIWFESRENEGSVFSFTLPLV